MMPMLSIWGCLLSARSEKGLHCASAIRCRCDAFDRLDDETLLNAAGGLMRLLRDMAA